MPAGPVLAEAVNEPPVALGPGTGGMVSGALLAAATPALATRSEPSEAHEASESRSESSAAASERDAKASGGDDHGEGKGNKNGGAEKRGESARESSGSDTLLGTVKLASADDKGNESGGRGGSNGSGGSGSSGFVSNVNGGNKGGGISYASGGNSSESNGDKVWRGRFENDGNRRCHNPCPFASAFIFRKRKLSKLT